MKTLEKLEPTLFEEKALEKERWIARRFRWVKVLNAFLIVLLLAVVASLAWFVYSVDQAKQDESRLLIILCAMLVLGMVCGIWALNLIFQKNERSSAELRAQERRFRRVVECLSEGIIINDEKDLMLYANSRLAELTGYSQEEIVGRHAYMLLPPEEWEKLREGTERRLQGLSDAYEVQLQRKDGGRLWAEFRAAPLRNPAGAIVGSLATVTDITERKRMLEALRESEERIRLFVEHAPAAVAMFDRQMRYVVTSRRWLSDYGLGDRDLIGKSHYEVFSEIPQRWREIHRRCLEGAIEKCEEDHFLRSDGRLEWVRWEIRPWRSGSGEIGGLIMFTEVITEKKRAAEALGEQQKFLRNVIDADPSFVFAKDWDGRFTLANKAIAEVYGTTPEELIGKRDADFNSNQVEVERFLRDDREVIATGREKFIPEEPVTNATTGETRWFQTVKKALHIPGESKAQVLGIAADITARKRAEEELRKSEAQFRTLAANVPGVVYLCRNDERYTMLYLNDGIEKLTGRPAKDFLEDRISFVELFHTADAPHIAPAVDAAIAARKPFSLVYRIKHKSGQWRWVEENGQGVFDEKGELRFLEGTILDVTEKRHAEEERRKLESSIQQAQKLESLGVLAGGIAHDFNNLLMGILGNAGLALMKASPESPVREGLKQIETAALRAADLTKQLLAYSGKGKFVMEVLDLSRLVEETSHLLRAIVSKKATLQVHFPSHLPRIHADPTQIRQVVMNLITNASDALEDKAGIIKVSTGSMFVDRHFLAGALCAEDLGEGHFSYVEVSDTGVGMDAETVAKIFDPFFTTKFTGRGLGLAAALGIVRGHKGCIKVHSEPGKGTTFLVLFPSTEKPVDVKPAVPQGLNGWRGAGTVLVVDDEESVRAVAKVSLEQIGFRVLCASDGKDGVETFRKHADAIVAVLLDMTMPRMDGQEALREMRKIRPEITIVLSSGYNEKESTKAIPLGEVDGFIQKPYQPLTLLEKMREVLEGKTLRPMPRRREEKEKPSPKGKPSTRSSGS